MKWIVSLSGGTASAITAIACHENHIPYDLVFADTLTEDEDLYRFIRELSVALDKPIHWLKDGRTIWDVFLDIGYMGNSRIAACSRILKTEQIKKWVAANSGPNDPLVLGMDMMEIDRITRAQKNWGTRPVVSLINDLKIKRKTFAPTLARYGLAEPRLYAMGFPHNNCGGACVRAGQTQWATLLERNRERYMWHENEQERIMLINPNLRPFLRITLAGTVYYLTLRMFRILVEAKQIKVEPYEYGGCGCFTDADTDIGPLE